MLFKNKLNRLENTKSFKDLDEISFSSYETAKIEMQENSSDSGRFSCDADQNLYKILDLTLC